MAGLHLTDDDGRDWAFEVDVDGVLLIGSPDHDAGAFPPDERDRLAQYLGGVPADPAGLDET